MRSSARSSAPRRPGPGAFLTTSRGNRKLRGVARPSGCSAQCLPPRHDANIVPEEISTFRAERDARNGREFAGGLPSGLTVASIRVCISRSCLLIGAILWTRSGEVKKRTRKALARLRLALCEGAAANMPQPARDGTQKEDRMEPSIGGPEERIAKLERSVRRLTGLAGMLALLSIAGLAWQLLPLHHVVEAERFVVRDRAGRVRGELGVSRDGSIALRLNNESGKARTMLRLDGEGHAMLRLTDPRGVNRAELALEGEGDPALYLTGPKGSVRTAARVAGEPGSQALVVRDASGAVTWSAP